MARRRVRHVRGIDEHVLCRIGRCMPHETCECNAVSKRVVSSRSKLHYSDLLQAWFVPYAEFQSVNSHSELYKVGAMLAVPSRGD